MSFNDLNRQYEYYQDRLDPAEQAEQEAAMEEQEQIGICETCQKEVWGYEKDGVMIVIPCVHTPPGYVKGMIDAHNKSVVDMVNKAMGVKT